MEEEANAVKERGNEYFKKGRYEAAAELYKKATFFDPNNHLLYGNLSAAFLRMGMLDEALLEARTATTLAPWWAKGHYREGCALEAMGRHEDALVAFFEALRFNPRNEEVSRKIERLMILTRGQKQAKEADFEINVDMSKILDSFKCELSEKIGVEEQWRGIFSFVNDIFLDTLNCWHFTGKIEQLVHFLPGEHKDQIDWFEPGPDINGAFKSREMRNSCFSVIQTYAEVSLSRAACIVVPKRNISYPQVWKEERLKKWKYRQSDGFFVQFESPTVRKLWFLPCKTKNGRTRFGVPDALDINAHELFPRLFNQVPDGAEASSTGPSTCMERKCQKEKPLL